ncbi:protein crumbs homolog 3 [Spea bombifrons]|uniref:protein crumbs homolog 3 n=1 Tax=Spea bombifrons TaxID=233779 RepID=UPI0023492E13|nr:protein crumbs homolog 3 [Spea bombifrons]
MDRPAGLLFLVAVCGLSFTRAQNTTEPTTQPPAKLSNSELLAAIIVPSVVGGLIIIGILYFIIAKIRERRRTEGTYRPSNEEQAGSRVEPNAGLKLPPEERLI